MSTASGPTSMRQAQSSRDVRMTDRSDDHGQTGLKVNPPDEYHGQRSKLDTWLVQCERYFAFKGGSVDEKKKVLFATTFFRGKAEDWIKPKTKEYLFDPKDKDVQGFFEEWDQFKKEVERVFGIANEDKIAERRIQELVQTKSAAEYAAEFQRWADRTEWDESALQYMYRKGLKEEVKDELMRDGRAIDNLKELMEVAIDLDDRLYERKIERNPRRRGGYGTASGSRPYFGGGRKSYQPAKAFDAMELDATREQRQGSPRKQGKKNFAKKEPIKCYGCGKPGHIKRNCRQEQSRQLPRERGLHATRRVTAQEMQEILRPRSGTPYPRRQSKAIDLPEDQKERITDWEDLKSEAETESSEEEMMRITPVNKEEIRHLVLQANGLSLVMDTNEKIFNNVMKNPWSMKVNMEATQRVSKCTKAQVEEALTNSQFEGNKEEEMSPLEERLKEGMDEMDWRKENEVLSYGNWDHDPRHPHHGRLHFTACFDWGCQTHCRAKEDNDYFPKQKGCGQRWTTCRNDQCEWHAIDKRYHQVFPGSVKSQAELWQQKALLQQNRQATDCKQIQWIRCILPNCETHYQTKRYLGFHPDDTLYKRNIHVYEKSGKD